MTPDSPKSPREELEARLTALLLGELSAEEAAALRHTISWDPELAHLENQLKETIGLVREAAASNEEKTVEPAAPLQLSAERREKLLASFKASPLELAAKPRRKFTLRLNRELLKLAAMIVALLLVGGVVVSYFTVSKREYFGYFAGEDDFALGLDLKPAEASSSAKGSVIIVKNGSESEVRLFGGSNPSDSPATAFQTLTVESTTPRSGKNAGGTMVDAYPADAAWERGNQPQQGAVNRPNRRVEAARAPADVAFRNDSVAGLLPPPTSGPEPANKQLAQNLERSRFRSTIALPTASDAQTPGATPSHYFGDSVANGVSFGSMPGSSLETIALGSTDGRPGLSNRGVGTELAGEPAGNRGNSWFGGMGGGGGGFGGGRGPAAPAEGKEAGRTPDPVDAKAFGMANRPMSRTNFMYAQTRQQGGWVNGSSETKDVNGPAPATGLPAVEVSGVLNQLSKKTTLLESLKSDAPTANPVPAVEPATGLPVASTSGGKNTSGLGLWDTGVDAERIPPLPAVVAAQPVTTLSGQTPPQGGYQFRLASDDVGGVVPFYKRGQEAAAVEAFGSEQISKSGASEAGVVAGVVTSQSGTAGAGVPHIDAGFGGTDGGVPVVVAKGAELARTIPSAPARRRVAPTPAETPAPAQKPDAAKTATFTDDMDALLVQTPNATAVPFATPSKAPPPPPTMPPAAAAPAPTVLEKNAAGQTLSDGLASDQTIELYTIDSPRTNSLHSLHFFADSPVGDMANRTGQRRSGGVVADPTQSTAEGLNWGVQQKVESDGDSVSRLARLKDLTQLDSKSRASSESDHALLNPRQPRFGNATEDESRWNVGAVLDSRSRDKLLRDKERLPQTAEAKPDRLEDLTQRESKEKALAEVQDKLGKADRADAGGVHSVNAAGYVNQNVTLGTTVSVAPPVANEERKKENEALITRANGSAGDVTVHRVGGATGPVTVQYETDGTIGNKKAGAADDFAVTMSRIDGRLGSLVGDAAQPQGQLTVGGEFAGVNASPQVSTKSLSGKSRTEIALPPGGANVQGVEREPRMQTGSVVINEVMYNAPAPERGRYAQRLNQTADPARTNRIQISGQVEEAQLSSLYKTDSGYDNKTGDIQGAKENLEYWKLKRELDTAKAVRVQLAKRAWQENVDQAMPRSSIVQIVDRAEAPPAKSPSFWGRVGSAFSSDPVATARIAVEKDASDIGGVSDGRTMGFDPYWTQTQFERIQSKAALEKVIEKLNLNEAWAKEHGGGNKLSTEDTLRLLKKKLDVRTKPNSSLIDIRVKDDDASEAARIANTVAEVYRDSRLEQSREVAAKGLQALKEEQPRLDKEIARIQDELERREKELKSRNAKVDVASVKQSETIPVQEAINVVIPLKTAPAADVARMLSSQAAIAEQPFLGKVKIIPDERSNSLLVFASGEDLSSVSNAIRRLDAPVPQGEVETAENNFSTFSLNVSDVSFKLAAASLEKGQMPDVATVRSEEFINAFDYRDPEPKGSAPIAFAWERTRYPFAHNRDLLRFSVKTAASGRQPGRPLNLVLLLDNSGSMERADRVRVVDECIRVLTGQLRPEDRVTVVAFARTAQLVVDGLTGTNIVTLPQQIGELAPDGGTNLEEAMNLAYQKALKHFLPNGVNRVVLLTDGAANLGDVDPESLKKKVEAYRKQGVALDCFGIGWDGYNDDLLEVLSRNGDGRYGFVNTPEAAASEFAGQLAGALRVAASDVKVQVEFNPRRVTTYRQIGYAKHQLKKEQFRDNTVDAAEIGAAEQGNALYTVQVNPNGEGPIGVVRVRFKVPGTSDYREHEWALPYSGAATPLEQSSPALRLAATASAFSEWLVSSQFASEVTPDRLLGYLSGVPETCAADPRPKKLEWMIRQARSLAGK